ncbi:Zn-ribbon domain-containing OB-fold protein [Parasphingorhabdus pacifica]
MSEHAVPAAPDAVYREGLASGELRFQRCGGCDNAIFYPRVLCPGCGSEDLRWQRSSGVGTVYATTNVRARTGVRNVVLVDLDEGFRMMSRVEDVEPDHVSIGLRVRFAVTDDEGGTPIAVFRKGGQK